MGGVVKSPRRSTTRPVANDTHIFAGFRKLFFGEARNAATVRSVRVGPRGGGQNSATFESGTGGQEEKVGRRILRKTFFFDRVPKQQNPFRHPPVSRISAAEFDAHGVGKIAAKFRVGGGR